MGKFTPEELALNAPGPVSKEQANRLRDGLLAIQRSAAARRAAEREQAAS